MEEIEENARKARESRLESAPEPPAEEHPELSKCEPPPVIE